MVASEDGEREGRNEWCRGQGSGEEITRVRFELEVLYLLGNAGAPWRRSMATMPSSKPGDGGRIKGRDDPLGEDCW